LDTDELDAAIGELEIRVERLRSLYEQYFLGIERIEPGVARKDVDRRIWQLKREKIRNTARRFKLQTIIQRYNTFQQYWQRICREIENGTYRRHVLRAERATTTVSDIVTQRQQAVAERDAAAQASEAAQSSADQVAAMLVRDVDAEQEFARLLAEAKSPTQRPAAVSARKLESLDLDLESEGLSSEANRRTGRALVPRPNPLAALGRRQDGPPGQSPLVTQQPPSVGRTVTRVGSTAVAGSTAPANPLGNASQRVKPPTPPAKQAPPASGISEQRIAELHKQLLAAKLRTRETGKVTVAGLAKSLRAAEQKLKQQHKDRRIDFDVVIKNGKAVVKPVVR
jgi:hypothetical protein